MHRSMNHPPPTSEVVTRGVVARPPIQLARAATAKCVSSVEQKQNTAANHKDFNNEMNEFGERCDELIGNHCDSSCANTGSDWKLKYLSIIQEAFSTDADGDTHLHLAIFYGLNEIAECFIDLVPDSRYLNIANNMRQTPLHIAVLIGESCLVRHLLLAGADCAGRDCHGNTALHYACSQADRACVQALTEPMSVSESVGQFGARADNTRLPLLNNKLMAHVDEWNYEGMTCLHLAVLSGDIEIVCQLVCHGASTEIPDGRAGRSALQLSIESRRQQIARILLVSCGACAHSCNYAGQNSRKLATEAGWHELARLMENQLSREGFRCCGDATSPEISPTRCSESGDPSDCELDSDSDSWKSGETRFYDSVDDRSTLIFKPLSST